MARVAELEKARSELDEPFGVDGADFTHVLLGREHELVVDDPVGLTLEERARGVNVRRSLLDDGFVTLLRIFLGAVEEETRADGFANFVVVASSARGAELVSIHDGEKLFTDVLRALHRTRL